MLSTLSFHSLGSNVFHNIFLWSSFLILHKALWPKANRQAPLVHIRAGCSPNLSSPHDKSITPPLEPPTAFAPHIDSNSSFEGSFPVSKTIMGHLGNHSRQQAYWEDDVLTLFHPRNHPLREILMFLHRLEASQSALGNMKAEEKEKSETKCLH